MGPYVLFLVLVELGGRIPGAEGALLPLKVLLPGAWVAICAWRGEYPELRVRSGGAAGQIADVAVGLGVALLWAGPYLAGWLPKPEAGDAFDPALLGDERRALALTLRGLGFAAVTPFVEEIFVRSFLIRWVETLRPGGAPSDTDFRALPVARYGAWSFWLTVAWFSASHAGWELPVAFATGVIYNLWLYRRGHLGAVIRAHAVTNAALFAGVLLADGRGMDLWYFL